MNGRLRDSIVTANRRLDANEDVIHWTFERLPIQQNLKCEVQDGGRNALALLQIVVATLAHDVQSEYPALASIQPIFLYRVGPAKMG